MINSTPAAIIFDLDGTLIDNNTFHIEAWKAFYEKKGLPFSMDIYRDRINGRINKDIFRIILGDDITEEEIENYGAEKEELYRTLYAPHIKPIDGLISFLESMQLLKMPMGIATSGIVPNIEFMFQHLPMRHFFSVITDGSMVMHGKPNPEIFLKTAASLQVNATDCIAFEDSIAGIRSARAAGMFTIGLSTTHTTTELIDEAHWVIPDYTYSSTPNLLKRWQHYSSK